MEQQSMEVKPEEQRVESQVGPERRTMETAKMSESGKMSEGSHKPEQINVPTSTPESRKYKFYIPIPKSVLEEVHREKVKPSGDEHTITTGEKAKKLFSSVIETTQHELTKMEKEIDYHARKLVLGTRYYPQINTIFNLSDEYPLSEYYCRASPFDEQFSGSIFITNKNVLFYAQSEDIRIVIPLTLVNTIQKAIVTNVFETTVDNKKVHWMKAITDEPNIEADGIQIFTSDGMVHQFYDFVEFPLFYNLLRYVWNKERSDS